MEAAAKKNPLLPGPRVPSQTSKFGDVPWKFVSNPDANDPNVPGQPANNESRPSFPPPLAISCVIAPRLGKIPSCPPYPLTPRCIDPELFETFKTPPFRESNFDLLITGKISLFFVDFSSSVLFPLFSAKDEYLLFCLLPSTPPSCSGTANPYSCPPSFRDLSAFHQYPWVSFTDFRFAQRLQRFFTVVSAEL